MPRNRYATAAVFLAAALALPPAFAQQPQQQPASSPSGNAAQGGTTAPPQSTANPPETQTPPGGTEPQATPPAATTPPAPQAPASGESRNLTDESHGVTMAAPGDWKVAPSSAFSVPGDVLRAWSPDTSASLVVFVQHPKGPTNPRTLLNQSVAAIKKSLGANVTEQDVRDIGGMRAMWLVDSGKGTGAAIDGKGTVPTAQHWVAIPRRDDIVILLLTAPQDKFASYDPVFQQSLQTLQIHGNQTASQRAAK